jgi:hypothetical protein
LLGYSSQEEWVKNEYPVGDVIESDQDTCIKAYMEASQHFNASTLMLAWERTNGEKILTDVTMVPISYKNEIFVLHFITPKPSRKINEGR